MKKLITRRERRLKQLMLLIVATLLSMGMNGFLLFGSYFQSQNINELKEAYTGLDSHYMMQIDGYEEQLSHLNADIALLSAQVSDLQSQVKGESNIPPTYTGKKVAYLTFDDGPTALTPKVLDVLKEHDAKATFFVLGSNAERNPDMLRRIVDEGHTLGNHSNTHKYESIYSGIPMLQAEIKRCNDIILEATGVSAFAFRFPGGSSNTMFTRYSPRITLNQWFDTVHSESMQYYDWNVSSLDASNKVVTADDIYNAVINGAVNKNQITVLMHDVTKNQATLDALPRMITKLKEMGYAIEAITSTSRPVQHKIAS